MATASGAAKVILNEQDISARATSPTGVYLGCAAPLIRGAVDLPFEINSPTQFLNQCTETGTVEIGYDTSYIEILTALSFTNKLMVSRAQNGALYGAAYVRSKTASDVNFPAEFGFLDSLVGYDLTSADGRPEVPDSVITSDSDQEYLTVPQAVYDLLVTGDTVQLTTTGTLPVPLAPATTYYVYKSDVDRKIGLASSLAGANANQLINITSFGIGTLTVTASAKVAGSDFVTNTTTNVVTVNPEFYAAAKTGDAVTLTTTGTLPAPLTTGTTFYLIVIAQTPNTIQLASSLLNAQGGVFLDLTTVGAGTATASFSAKSITGTATVDMSDDTFAVSDSAFYNALVTGDELVLQEGVNTTVLPSSGGTALLLNTVYYAVKLPGQKLSLADSLLHAQNDVILPIDNPGSGIITAHNASIVPTSSGDDKVLLFYGADPGAWNNNVGFKLTNFSTNPILVKEPDAFLLQIYQGVAPVESWLCSRDPNAKNASGQSLYVEDVLLGSAYLRALNNVAIDVAVQPKDQLTILALAGGSNGNVVADGDMIVAINKLADEDTYPMSIVTDMGWTTAAYHTALVALAESRDDCAFVISTPFSVEAAADYVQAIIDYKTVALNTTSSYGGIWSSHLLVSDASNNRDVYVSPSSYVAGKICYTWANVAAWQPVAGTTYGQLNVLGVHRTFNAGQMDTLQDYSINPIRWKRGQGTTIWGQKTTQTRASDLDRMNARLLLCVIKPALKQLLEAYLFRLLTIDNNVGTRAALKARIQTYMSGVKTKNGVYDYQIICDGRNNGDADVENNTINIWLLVKIIKSVEYIPLTIGITPFGLTFDIAAGLITG